MALLLPRSVFIHVPKTGGTWVRAAVAKGGIPVSELGCVWHEGVVGARFDNLDSSLPIDHTCFHNKLKDIDAGGRFTFAFVRHPLSLYRSYWMYRMQRGWDMRLCFEKDIADDDFNAFVRKALKRFPDGMWTDAFTQLLTHQNRTVDFIGKQECLVDDLVYALQLAGEEFDENALCATPLTNASDTAGDLADRTAIDSDLERRILETEAWSLRLYGYASAGSQP